MAGMPAEHLAAGRGARGRSLRRLSAGALSRASRIRSCGSAELIEALERRWNDPARSDAARRTLGIVTMMIVAGSAGAVGYAIADRRAAAAVRNGASSCWSRPLGLAQRSLYTHVRDVLRPLRARRSPGSARRSRDRSSGAIRRSSTPPGVAAAAIESLAESFNDGIVAPAFWFARRRTARTVRLQGAEHRRQPDRPSRAALARVRLGGGARGRPGQSRPRAHRRRC